MKRSTKIILITAALITATGAAVASRGQGCDQRGGMQGMYGPGVQGMQQMQRPQGMRGNRPFGAMGAIYQLDNLTDTQKQQVTELRRTQHEKMFNLREQKWQQRAEMKKQVEAILTEEQRQQLQQIRSGL